MEVRLTKSLFADGESSKTLDRAMRGGAIVRVRYGAYASELAADERLRHRQLIDGTVPRLAPAAVLSHRSAAILHGLPLWPETPPRVHITRKRSSGGRRSPHLWVHTGPLFAEDVTEIDGWLVTGLARTIADLGRTMPLDRALATADAGLRLGCPPLRLLQEVQRSERRRGARQVRFVAGFADGRAESPGESSSRLLIHQVNLPPPRLQYDVVDPTDGEVVARCDFGWEAQRTVGEYDGRGKYGRLLQPGQDPGTAVFGEKIREDRVRALGYEVVRWTQPDLTRPRLFRERILAAFGRAAARTR